MIKALKAVEDPRRKQGQRYDLAWLLAIMLCTIMCKLTGYRQMSRLAARLPGRGIHRIPDPSTFHRVKGHWFLPTGGHEKCPPLANKTAR
ncbi:transposase family protein [Glutamicibacter uratoxydans]|uniref:transposase family protein n=1 Tax=Glutamicibacter uratoxydans TaxID=43667 RepID=UPI003D6E5510